MHPSSERRIAYPNEKKCDMPLVICQVIIRNKPKTHTIDRSHIATACLAMHTTGTTQHRLPNPLPVLFHVMLTKHNPRHIACIIIDE